MLYNGNLTNNAATQHGGAVYVKGSGSNGKFTLTGGTLTQNIATQNGGAVYIEAGSFDMKSDTRQGAATVNIQIAYNYASGNRKRMKDSILFAFDMDLNDKTLLEFIKEAIGLKALCYKFTMKEVSAMKNVGEMMDIIAERG